MLKTKKRRVAVIGSSHIGALQLACNESNRITKDVEMTFYGARSSMYRDAIDTPILRNDGEKLKPATEELSEAYEFTSGIKGGELVVGDYDSIIIYGFAPRIEPEFLDKYSEQMVIEYFEARRADSPMFAMLNAVKQTQFNGQLFIAPPPMKAPIKLSNSALLNDYHRFAKLYSDYIAKCGATLLTQPDETLTSSATTKREYARGSVKLDVGKGDTKQHREGDTSHMNAKYGELCLKKWLK